MSAKPWRCAAGWEALLRHTRSDVTFERVSSLLVMCVVEDDGGEYRYMQHWLNGQLATWEATDSFGVDLVVHRSATDEDRIWGSSAPWQGLVNDRFRTPATSSWSTYPPRPYGCDAADDVADAVLSIRVQLQDPGREPSEIGLIRRSDGSWAECRSASSGRVELAEEHLSLALSSYDWVRLVTGRSSFVQLAERIQIDGEALLLGALQSGLATADNLSASTAIWPALLFYEEYLSIIAALDTDELRMAATFEPG